MLNKILLLLIILLNFSIFSASDDDILSPDTPQHLNTDKDKKRRLSILMENKDWPRRIQRFVREGEICLDMSEDQMVAAWGKPLQKSDAFATLLGEHKLFVYPAGSFSYTIVIMKDKKIIGWSQKVSE